MNTYTKDQVNNALRILSEVFENDPKFLNLPATSKETLAKITLEAFKIKPKQ